MEKHGHLVLCFNEIRQMLQTPIKSYSQTETHTKKKGMDKPSVIEGMGSGDEDEEGMERPRSPQAQHSSSDGGSDLEELLSKKFPQEDLPSHITRAMGKGVSYVRLVVWGWSQYFYIDFGQVWVWISSVIMVECSCGLVIW